jgi:hypothetical protein
LIRKIEVVGFGVLGGSRLWAGDWSRARGFAGFLGFWARRDRVAPLIGSIVSGAGGGQVS